jgi:predicted RNA binding protein YcfA (HicA-like mRNA interferase family)
MTRIAKLYAEIIGNPQAAVSFRDFERLIEALGFELKRIHGSHRHYKHPDVPELLTVLPEGKNVKRYLLRELRDMVERYQLGVEE